MAKSEVELCVVCGSVSVKPHCESSKCGWVVCKDCGAISEPGTNKFYNPTKN